MTGSDNVSATNPNSPSAPAYQILSANSIHELERQAIAALKAGMRLHGYPFAFKDNICQAVIRS